MAWQHRRPGLAVGLIFAAAIVLFAGILWADKGVPAVWVSMMVSITFLVLLWIMFGGLSVHVVEDRVRLWFGPGWVNRHIPRGVLVSAEAVRNIWWWGLGMLLHPLSEAQRASGHKVGWSWNVHVLDQQGEVLPHRHERHGRVAGGSGAAAPCSTLSTNGRVGENSADRATASLPLERSERAAPASPAGPSQRPERWATAAGWCPAVTAPRPATAVPSRSPSRLPGPPKRLARGAPHGPGAAPLRHHCTSSAPPADPRAASEPRIQPPNGAPQPPHQPSRCSTVRSARKRQDTECGTAGACEMLPDTLDLCDRETKWNYVAVLTLLANADGQLVREEMAALESRMGHALLHPDTRAELRQLLKNPPDFHAVISGMDEQGLRLTLRDGMLIAACDGEYHEDEVHMLDLLAEAAGVDEETVHALYGWVTEGWRWMAESRRLLGLLIPGDEELLAKG